MIPPMWNPLPHSPFSSITLRKAGISAQPVGAGADKVRKHGSTILNAFIERQWTVDHDGDGFPKFAIFGGINVTLGK